ncbi:MAG: hypothetical protein HC914_00075 [Chloroflexaceae bacterium]|nr:hypothetical protein [Chloroflexaceae bacterium]
MTNLSEQSNDQLPADDLLLLSAYLDDALEPAEHTRLAARLPNEPLLRYELDELRATRQMLRDLPQLVPPRSFSIDPNSVPGRRRGFGWFGLGGGLLAFTRLVPLLLVVVVAVGVVGVVLNQAGGAPLAMVPEAIAPESSELQALEAPPDTLLADEAPEAARIAGDAAESAPAAEMAAEAPADKELAGVMSAPEEDVSGTMHSGPMLPTDDSEMAGSARLEEPAGAAPADVPEAAAPVPTSNIAANDTSSPDTRELETAPPVQSTPQNTASNGLLPLILIGVAVLAALVGLTFWLVRRRANNG